METSPLRRHWDVKRLLFVSLRMILVELVRSQPSAGLYGVVFLNSSGESVAVPRWRVHVVCLVSFLCLDLELDHDGHSKTGFILAQIGVPDAAVIGARCRCQSRTRGRVVHTDELSGCAVVSSRRSDSASARKVRHIRVAISEFPEKRDVLSGHVVERDRVIPRLER